MAMYKSEVEKNREFLQREYDKAIKCRKNNPRYMYKRIAELSDPNYLRGWPKYMHEYARGYYDGFMAVMIILMDDRADEQNNYLRAMLTGEE